MPDRLAWNWGRNTKRGRLRRLLERGRRYAIADLSATFAPTKSMTICGNASATHRLDRHDVKTRIRRHVRTLLKTMEIAGLAGAQHEPISRGRVHRGFWPSPLSSG